MNPAATVRTRASAALLVAATLVHAPTAAAVEVDFEGSYQLRGRYYNSLSLTAAAEGAIPEGTALYGEHRLWMRPRFLLSDDVRLTVDILGLDNVVWGNRPTGPGSFTNLPVLDEQLTAPVGTSDPTDALRDISIWRAWGDVDFSFGRFSFGRMPLHWGRGIWQNDGLGINNEYGDTADRLQFETLLQDSIFIRVAFDTHAENFVNTADDTFAPSISAAYRSERIVAGVQVHYRHTEGTEGAEDLDLVTIDGSGEAELGPLSISGEALARFGSGRLGDLDDVSINGFGGVLVAELSANPWRIQIEAGFATGDNDDTDDRYRTFHFDPDYNVGVILFEQPLPVFATAASNDANGNRDFGEVLLDNRVSNALYLKPTIGRTLADGLELQASGLLARAASLPSFIEDRSNYGLEIQAAVNYTGIEHFELDARGAVFLPGTYFRNFSSDLIQGYDRTAVGFQLTSRIRF